MVGLPDGEKRFEDIYSRTEYRRMTDGHADRLTDGQMDRHLATA